MGNIQMSNLKKEHSNWTNRSAFLFRDMLDQGIENDHVIIFDYKYLVRVGAKKTY